MPHRYSAAHRRAKAILKAAIAAGAGIEAGSLPDHPRFTYTPGEPELFNGKPSPRGSFAPSLPKGDWRRKLRTWKPSRLSAAPQYNIPMTDESDALRRARRAWHEGDPKPLRELLASRSEHTWREAA